MKSNIQVNLKKKEMLYIQVRAKKLYWKSGMNALYQ